jgi:hypothetical protein
MSAPPRLCQTCTYYAPRPDGAASGQCRIHPPKAGGWPEVRADEWCGEHEPSPEAWAEIERKPR